MIVIVSITIIFVSNQINYFFYDLLKQKRPGEVLTRPGRGIKKSSCRRNQRGTFYIILFIYFTYII